MPVQPEWRGAIRLDRHTRKGITVTHVNTPLLAQILSETTDALSKHPSFDAERIARLERLTAKGEVPSSTAIVQLLKTVESDRDDETSQA